MLSSTNSQQRSYPVPHNKLGSLDLWEQLVFRGASTLFFLLGFNTVQCLSWFLRFSLRGGEWWVVFIFCLSCSRVDSSEDLNHQRRVKGGKWPCLSQVISSSLLLPHELKNKDTKRRILNILKVAHEKFTWIGRKIPHIGWYGGHRWHGFWLKVLDAQAAFPLSTEF